ncbi:type IV secretion system DNA-binding domain-containing protein [Orientia tsutsugamushi]|uniref:type IV secretion system DNA-binding domain-containing protein n=1 Tax=Orientia tsutsugamushi TaxID=784 RepID=UPI0035280FD1
MKPQVVIGIGTFFALFAVAYQVSDTIANSLNADIGKDIIKLIHTIIYSDNRQFAKAFRNTAVSGIISEGALETSAGIQSTLGKNITSLQYLKPGGSFSIKEWFSIIQMKLAGYLSQLTQVKELLYAHLFQLG